jgi:hypothetical protein
MKYLYVSGRLADDNGFTLRPGYLDERPRRIQRQESPFAVEMLDARDKPLLRFPLPLRDICAFGAREVSTARPVHGWVPFPEGTRSLRFVHQRIIVHELAVSEAAPEIALTSAPARGAGGTVILEWRAKHAQGLPLSFFCRYSNDDGAGWQRIGFRTTETRKTFDLDHLPGGKKCVFEVVATDGVNTTAVRTAAFTVAPKPLMAIIRAPHDGDRIPAGQRVLLNGHGFSIDEQRIESEALVWTSSRDGELGNGRLVEVTLSTGEHIITLEAGEGDRRGHERVTVVSAVEHTQGLSF